MRCVKKDIRHFIRQMAKKKKRTHPQIIDEIRELHDKEDILLDELEDTCCSIEDKAFNKRLEDD